MRCCICGEKKDDVDFNPAHAQTIRFQGGHIAAISVIPMYGDICTRCQHVMQTLLAESKVLYPESVRKALKEDALIQ